ncbi:MAG: hypothetical protein K9N23_19280, partial [Akkermansiaceae bacterium]|nr:hypothetical protein [Akkermansiaceae bacterium]
MRDNQRKDGYLGSVIPLVDRVLDDCNCVWWNGMIVYTPWNLYEYYGDPRFLAESYPAMVSSMNWLATQVDKDKIVSWGLGDWIEVGSTSSPKRTSVAITSTCGYYYYATILSRSAPISTGCWPGSTLIRPRRASRRSSSSRRPWAISPGSMAIMIASTAGSSINPPTPATALRTALSPLMRTKSAGGQRAGGRRQEA